MRISIEVKDNLELPMIICVAYLHIMSPVTLRVRELRGVRRWSQAELARQSGVDQSVISRLENGETQAVSFKNLERLADALGCDPGYLVLKK